MLKALHQAFPLLPVNALVDLNPAGLTILSVYKYGCARTALGAGRSVHREALLLQCTLMDRICCKQDFLEGLHDIVLVLVWCRYAVRS